MNNNTNEFAIVNTESGEVTTTPTVQHYDDDERMIVDLTERTTSYCSLVATTEDEKLTLYNAMNNQDKRLADMINEKISVKDVFVEVVKCENRETGEKQSCPRIVLIDSNGIGYQCVSIGIFSALKKLFSVFGEPGTWEKPVTVKVKQI